jgi:tripartite-type tricarboxylate transporter receptor subunit TctC
LHEEGVSNVDLVPWYATYFPAKTPVGVAETMRSILLRASKTKVVVEALNTFAMEQLAMSGEDLNALNRKEVDMYTKMLRQAGIIRSKN